MHEPSEAREATSPPRREDHWNVLRVVEAQRVSQDSMLWQVPALAIAAEAFLLSVILNPDAARGVQILVAALGAVLLVSAGQLLRRHRELELQRSRWLERYEERYSLPRLHQRSYFECEPPQLWEEPVHGRKERGGRTADLWLALLVGLALVNLVLAVLGAATSAFD